MNKFDENFLETKNRKKTKYTLQEIILNNEIDLNKICIKEKQFFLENCDLQKNTPFCERLKNTLISCLAKNEII
jgi:hypothetical protein